MHLTDGKGRFLGVRRTLRHLNTNQGGMNQQFDNQVNERVVVGGELAPLTKISSVGSTANLQSDMLSEAARMTNYNMGSIFNQD